MFHLKSGFFQKTNSIDKIIRNLIGFLLLLLFISRPAFANIPPQQEGCALYLFSIPLGLFMLYLASKKVNIGWMAGFFVLSVIAGPLPELIVILMVIMVVYLIGAIKDAIKNPERRKASYAIIIIACICIASYVFALWSTSYYFLNRQHEDIMKRMQETSQTLEEQKGSSTDSLYPADEMSVEVASFGKRGNVVYKPAPDRLSYDLVYEGTTFSESVFFNMPPGYPRYNSVKGFEPGVRRSAFIGLLKNIPVKRK